jgi:signal transduction histidine kinase
MATCENSVLSLPVASQTFMKHEIPVMQPADAFAQLQQRDRELALLSRTVQALTSTLNLNEVLALVLEELRHLLQASASSVWLIDGATTDLVCRHATGPRAGPSPLWRVPTGIGFVGWVMQHGESLIVPDALLDPRHYSGIDEQTGLIVRSVLSVPLKSRHNIIGVLQAVDDRPDRFEGETLRLVETLATAAAVAIENARLFEETRLRADRLAILNEISTAINQPDSLAAVCTTATKELTRALNVTQAAVALFDEPRRRLYIVADAPALGSPPLVGVDLPLENNLSMQRILETRAPLAIYDAQNDPLLAALHEVMQQRHVRSILIVPLLVQGEVIGTFGCDAVNAPRHFTQEDIDLTVTVANLIAARIEQARLFEAERDQRLLAQAMRASAAALNRTLYFEEVLDRVLETVGRVVPHDAANIMLVDADGVAHVARGHGYAERGVEILARMASYPVDQVPTFQEIVRLGGPIVLSDVRTYPGWITIPELHWERSYAAAPIRVKGSIIGFLQVTSVTPGYFTQTHAERLQAFADQAAAAIENARLYAQVQHYADELEQRVAERTAELNTAYERLKALDQVKDQFVSRVSHELRTPIANIQLYLNLLDKGKPAKHADYMQTLHREAARLNKMIEDLLDISHLDMGKTEFHFAAVDLNRLLSHLVTERKPDALERGMTLESELAAALPSVHADTTLIAQTVSNLLSNALNYTPDGGRIICRTAQRDYADRSWVTVTVQDDGPGMAADELSRVGERFFRGRAARNYKVPGTGLGLALCKEIIDRHGGRMTIDSEPGQGAAFTVWLRPIQT